MQDEYACIKNGHDLIDKHLHTMRINGVSC